MRDPHRFSWDAGGQHRMFLGHIGEHAIEAVYEVDAGDNFGWSEREGRFVYKNDRRSAASTRCPGARREVGYDYPVAAYDHDPPADWPLQRRQRPRASSAASSTAATCPACTASTSSATWSTAAVFYTEGAQMREDPAARRPSHEMQLFDTAGTAMRMPTSPATAASTCGSASTPTAASTCWPRPTGRSGRSSAPGSAPVDKEVEPSLADDLVASYDFEHPFAAERLVEADQGLVRTLIQLVNGGKQMRVDDGAYPGSNNALQTHSSRRATTGNDDWKAGV